MSKKTYISCWHLLFLRGQHKNIFLLLTSVGRSFVTRDAKELSGQNDDLEEECRSKAGPSLMGHLEYIVYISGFQVSRD